MIGKPENLANLIFRGFRWYKTKQGSDYWDKWYRFIHKECGVDNFNWQEECTNNIYWGKYPLDNLNLAKAFIPHFNIIVDKTNLPPKLKERLKEDYLIGVAKL